MQLTVTIKDEIAQKYLDHYNAVYSTELTLQKLSPKQRHNLEQGLIDVMVSEVEMRTDDLHGFEAETYFRLHNFGQR